MKMMQDSMNNKPTSLEQNKATKLCQNRAHDSNYRVKEYSVLKSIISYPSSPSLLAESERKILSYADVKTTLVSRTHFVNVGPIIGNEDILIRTFSINEKSEKTPLVLIHGFGASIGMWVMNLAELGTERPLHAIDLPGFGRSSRPNFSSAASEVEHEMVRIIETWRKEMKLERVIFLAHSLGGFLSTSYTMQYPNRVSKLILAEPWGFSEKPAGPNQMFLPCYLNPVFRFILSLVVSAFTPLWFIRAFGRIGLGPKSIDFTTPMLQKYSIIADEAVSQMADYIFHCNSQNPTGEAAFQTMMTSNNWSFAKCPLFHRIPSSLNEDVPITLIFGSNSWFPNVSGSEMQKLRPKSYVDVQIIEGASHDIYAEGAETFNQLVLNACAYSDQNDLQRFSSTTVKQRNQDIPE